ncbi:FtsK/SpoIIIE domain-containing protein [Frankia sp. QA3]|uniref:FtsK/SpoIIIE domain-containing protein n=1 Tax=Frankia sp. QA3 TaxID=710111 RepID=UPI000269C426|nr:FtsK/SpoIIIE domain-containing protein [Frankia sp. QA3]EIV94310.1 DNA segregation ATPase, FtsK/SpoIIIE family [Frankia sp. QA3]
MQLAFTVHDVVTGTNVDVLLRAGADTPLGVVAGALAAAVRPPHPGGAPARASPSLTLAGSGRPLRPSLPLARSPLHEGATVILDAPPARRASGMGLVHLMVTAGPDAGVIHPLPVGEHTVGSAPGSAIMLAGPTTDAPVLTVRVAPDGRCSVTPGPGSTVVGWEGAKGDGSIVASVRTPSVALRLLRPTPIAPLALPSSVVPGRLDVNRPPRLHPPQRASTFALPAAPEEPRRAPIPVLATLLPLLAAVGMAAVLRTLYVLLFAVLGPLNLVVSVVSGRRRDRREFRQATARHRRLCDEVERAAQVALETECAERHAEQPDPASLFATAWQRDSGLWRRRRGDADYLRLRIGTANQPSAVRVTGATGLDHPSDPINADLPAVIALSENGVVGVAGPGARSQELGCWLLAQAAVLHSPEELTICVLAADADRAAAWRWIRWLPHCRSAAGDGAGWFAADAADRVARVAELRSLMQRRQDLPPDRHPAGPDVLLVLDGARALRSTAGLVPVLRSGPPVGIHVICLDSDIRDLPAECRAVVESDGGHLTVRQDRAAVIRNVRPDLVGPAGDRGHASGTVRWCESVARALAPLRVAADDDAALPVAMRLSDITGVGRPTASTVLRGWSFAPDSGIPPRSRPVPVGVAGGRTFTLDLPRDGPHGLIAGTTGSGKSELLQTIIAAHAVTYRPDELVFVLVDYKGGSAFAECAALPHTVGLVTDLDPHLVRRALISLSAELQRREALLARAGAKDLDALRRTATGAGELTVPPRLVLVVDEFATLARELPEFVTGLVSLAQRGRSLGIHLLLATQRPSGVVSPEIRANTNLRIALRVTDAAESEDVVGCPDAAAIVAATPGRAVVRTGPDRVTTVQTAWVGGRVREEGDGSPGQPAPRVTLLAWPGPGSLASGPGRPDPTVASRDTASPDTELTVLVRAVREAATVMGLPAPPSPWLPPLPERIALSSLHVLADGDEMHARPAGPPGRRRSEPRPTGTLLAPVVIGLSDRCDRQLQQPLTLDLEDGGHLMVVGAPRSGRSTVLRTAAGAIAGALSPRDVHIYGLDYGGGALAALTSLPHTGALVGRDDPERIGRMLARLIVAVEQRRRRLAADGVADLREARRGVAPAGGNAAVRLPYLVLLLDGFEGLLASSEDADGGELVESLLRLLGEGPAAGLKVILSTDRRGLIGRLASLIDERLILRMADSGDYALAGISPLDVPEQLTPGRGVVIGGRFPTPVEVQVALLDAEPTGRAQVAALRTVGARAQAGAAAMAPDRAGDRPFRVEALPDCVSPARMTTAAQARRDAPARRATAPQLRAALGLGGDELDVVDIDLGEDPGFVVGGPPRSGRSSALLTIALSLLAGGSDVVAVTPRPSALRALAGHSGVLAVVDAELSHLAGSDSVGGSGLPFPPPGTTQPLSGMVPPWAVMQGDRPPVVLVDDAELIGEQAAAELASFWQRARDAGGALVVAGATEELVLQYRGFVVDVRREGHGLLLAPRRPVDGELLGVRLPRTSPGPAPAGRGFLVRRGVLLPVQVACPPATVPLPLRPRHTAKGIA